MQPDTATRPMTLRERLMAARGETVPRPDESVVARMARERRLPAKEMTR